MLQHFFMAPSHPPTPPPEYLSNGFAQRGLNGVRVQYFIHYLSFWCWWTEQQQHGQSIIIPPLSDAVSCPGCLWLIGGGSSPLCSQCRCWLHVLPATWLLPHAPRHKLGGWWWTKRTKRKAILIIQALFFLQLWPQLRRYYREMTSSC